MHGLSFNSNSIILAVHPINKRKKEVKPMVSHRLSSIMLQLAAHPQKETQGLIKADEYGEEGNQF